MIMFLYLYTFIEIIHRVVKGLAWPYYYILSFCKCLQMLPIFCG